MSARRPPRLLVKTMAVTFLAFAVLLAAGLKGIEEGYELPPEAEANVFALTPEDAGWSYCGLRVLALTAGEQAKRPPVHGSANARGHEDRPVQGDAGQHPVLRS